MKENCLSNVFLQLLHALNGKVLDGTSRSTESLVISAVGGGGKTTTLYLLAETFARAGIRVCLTTTTHIYDPRTEQVTRPFNTVVILPEIAEAPLADETEPAASVPGKAITGNKGSATLQTAMRHTLPALSLQSGSVTLIASEEAIPDSPVHQSGGSHPLLKLGGIHPQWVETLREFWDMVLVEADGAKHRPVKAPAVHEPVIPDVSDLVIGCVGLDCLGKPMDESHVHRPALFGAITGCGTGEPISFRHIISLVLHPQGLFKGCPAEARRILLLNKGDALSEKTLREVEETLDLLTLGSELEVLLGSACQNRLFGRWRFL